MPRPTHPAPGKAKRYLLTVVTGVIVAGIFASLWIFQTSRSADFRRIHAEFERRADSRAALTQQIIAYYESGLYALRSLFEGSDQVTAGEFRELATDLLARLPGIAALEWVPVVPDAERTEVEAAMSHELGRPFHFTERNREGQLVRAGDRREYLPILFVEPLAGNASAQGLDVQTAPTSNYLEAARRTRQFTVTARFELIQGGPGVVMAWPVFTRAPGASTEQLCRGFVQGVFRVDEMLHQVELHSPSSAIDELYVDLTAQDNTQRVLYSRRGNSNGNEATPLSEDEVRHGVHRNTTIAWGGRQWEALYRPTAGWVAAQRSHQPLLWLAVGLGITGLLAALTISIGRRTVAIEREVELRTAELTESRRQLSGVLQALPGVAFRFGSDAAWTVFFISEGVLPLTGYHTEEFLDQRVRFRDLVHPDELERLERDLQEAIGTRREIEVEFRIQPRNGSEKWVLVRARAVFREDGQPPFIEGLALDITRRKQAENDKMQMERRLLESQKLESLGLLAGGIAHDFNNILTGIMGHASLARYAPVTEPEINDHLFRIEAGVSRAAELCQQMLAFAGRGRFVTEVVDLNRIVRDTLPLLQGSLPTRARLELALAAEPAIVMADATQLRQIVMNLILNAGEALLPTGGEVVVRTGIRQFDQEFLSTARVGEKLAPGNYVFLEVRDTGCGMAPETLAKIFDPFFTTKFTGRGLGLAAVLGIVRGHAGALGVNSAVGRGSTFTLVLPVSSGTGEANGETSPVLPWRRRGRVLVIDDEEPVREVAARLLSTFGLTVVTAEGGAQGIGQFRTNPAAFDLVFLDLTMPGLDGVETLAGLRAISPSVRVLLVSGYSETERISSLAAAGNLAFLQKPFSRSKLEQKLRAMLD